MKNLLRKIKWQLLYVIKYLFYTFGKSWSDFYGWMLDYQDRKITLDDILSKKGPANRYKGLWHWEKGEDYLRYMIKHGVKPNHVIFDFGCGYGRCTIPLLRYQSKKGRYIGSEISKKRLRIAEDWIQRESLKDKNYELVFSKDEDLNFLADNSVDITWVLSVFNHMPDNTLEKTLQALAKKMKSGGLLFAYYVNEDPSSKSVKFFPRTDHEMRERLLKHGFEPSELADWESEYSKNNRSGITKMMLGKKTEAR